MVQLSRCHAAAAPPSSCRLRCQPPSTLLPPPQPSCHRHCGAATLPALPPPPPLLQPSCRRHCQPLLENEEQVGCTKYYRKRRTSGCRNTTNDKRVWFDEVPREENGIIPLDRRAPIKMVSGRAWSPGIYQSLRLLDKSLDVAWERAFIRPLTFN